MKKLLLILVLIGTIALLWHYKPTTRIFGANTAISGLTSYTTPISGDVLPINDTANSTTKKITVDNLFNVLSSLFRIKDSTDTSKKVSFNLSLLTTATTRSIVVPDADLTLVGVTTQQSLSNKTFADLLTAANVLVQGSSTLQNFTSVNSTSTSATSTNIYVSGNASTTKLYVGTAPCSGTSALNVSTTGQVTCGVVSTSGGISNFSTTTTTQLATTTITSSFIPSTNTIRVIIQFASTTAAASVPNVNIGSNNLFMALNGDLTANKYRSRTTYFNGSTYSFTDNSNNTIPLSQWSTNRNASSTITAVMDISNITGQQKTGVIKIYSGAWDNTFEAQEVYFVYNNPAQITQIDIWHNQGEAATIFFATSSKFTLYGI